MDGIKLTRAQVEFAMKELNKPQEFKRGQVVRRKKDGTLAVVVVGGEFERWATAIYGAPYKDSIRITDGCSTWTAPLQDFEITGEVLNYNG